MSRTSQPAFHFDHVLGTSLDLWVTAADPDAVAGAVLAEVERVGPVFGLRDADSELSRLNRGPVPGSPELRAVLAGYDRLAPLTDGALNPLVGALACVWADAEQAGREPATDVLARLAAEIDRRGWEPRLTAWPERRCTRQRTSAKVCPRRAKAVRAGAAGFRTRRRHGWLQARAHVVGADLFASTERRLRQRPRLRKARSPAAYRAAARSATPSCHTSTRGPAGPPTGSRRRPSSRPTASPRTSSPPRWPSSTRPPASASSPASPAPPPSSSTTGSSAAPGSRSKPSCRRGRATARPSPPAR